MYRKQWVQGRESPKIGCRPIAQYPFHYFLFKNTIVLNPLSCPQTVPCLHSSHCFLFDCLCPPPTASCWEVCLVVSDVFHHHRCPARFPVQWADGTDAAERRQGGRPARPGLPAARPEGSRSHLRPLASKAVQGPPTFCGMQLAAVKEIIDFHI